MKEFAHATGLRMLTAPQTTQGPLGKGSVGTTSGFPKICHHARQTTLITKQTPNRPLGLSQPPNYKTRLKGNKMLTKDTNRKQPIQRAQRAVQISSMILTSCQTHGVPHHCASLHGKHHRSAPALRSCSDVQFTGPGLAKPALFPHSITAIVRLHAVQPFIDARVAGSKCDGGGCQWEGGSPRINAPK